MKLTQNGQYDDFDPVPLLFFGIDLLHMSFRALKLPAAFVTVINLHIEILGLILRIFLGQPDALLGGDIPGRILTAKWAVDQIIWAHVSSF